MSGEVKGEFSRVNRVGEKMGELRINTPASVLAVIDTVAISETKASGKMVSRTDIVNRLLTSFVVNKIDEATLINQVIGNNPTVLE
jgi:hypothetical protein